MESTGLPTIVLKFNDDLRYGTIQGRTKPLSQGGRS